MFLLFFTCFVPYLITNPSRWFKLITMVFQVCLTMHKRCLVNFPNILIILHLEFQIYDEQIFILNKMIGIFFLKQTVYLWCFLPISNIWWISLIFSLKHCLFVMFSSFKSNELDYEKGWWMLIHIVMNCNLLGSLWLLTWLIFSSHACCSSIWFDTFVIIVVMMFGLMKVQLFEGKQTNWASSHGLNLNTKN